MAKSLVKKTSPVDKKIAALIKRVEALEDQSFAQKLLNDDLESKLEQAEDAIKNYFGNPFQVPYQSPVPSGFHVCQSGHPDIFGTVTCMTCGQVMYMLTTTIGSGLNDVAVTVSSTTPSDDIDITWAEPCTLLSEETKG